MPVRSIAMSSTLSRQLTCTWRRFLRNQWVPSGTSHPRQMFSCGPKRHCADSQLFYRRKARKMVTSTVIQMSLRPFTTGASNLRSLVKIASSTFRMQTKLIKLAATVNRTCRCGSRRNHARKFHESPQPKSTSAKSVS